MTRPIRRSALVLALSALALGGALGPLTAGSDNMPLHCEIVPRPSGQGITLEARTTAEDAVEGVYSLDIRQKSGSGSTVIRQGGDFSLRAGETKVLGRVTLGHDPAGYEARLLLRADGHEIACSVPGASEI